MLPEPTFGYEDATTMFGGGGDGRSVRTGAEGRFALTDLPRLGAGEVAAQLDLQLGRAGRIKISAPSESQFLFVRASYVGEDLAEGERVAPVMQQLNKGKERG